MDRRQPAALAALLVLLGGCGLNATLERLGWRAQEEPLDRVLVSAETTPGHQGLLYTAIAEAEAAAQSADRALARAEEVEDVRTAIGEVLYAIEPDLAPDWGAKQAGIVPGWTASGYGVRRAAGELREELARVASGQGRAGEAAALALICVENTIERADRLIELADQALVAEAAALADALPEIDALARRLNRGHELENGELEPGEGECGLQHAAAALDEVRF